MAIIERATIAGAAASGTPSSVGRQVQPLRNANVATGHASHQAGIDRPLRRPSADGGLTEPQRGKQQPKRLKQVSRNRQRGIDLWPCGIDHLYGLAGIHVGRA